MNRISICGHGAGQKSPAFNLLSKEPNRWDVVFINNPGEDRPTWVDKLAKSVLHLQFDDISFENKKLKMPDIDDVTDALEWTKNKGDVLFTCNMGISRSSAMAYVCACQDYYPEDAIKLLKPGVHSPNQKIVQLSVAVLKERQIWDTLQLWLESDYNNEDIGIEYTKY